VKSTNNKLSDAIIHKYREAMCHPGERVLKLGGLGLLPELITTFSEN
jgi:hypothetical protein